MLAETVVAQHPVDGEQMAGLAPSAQLPVPSAGEQHGLIARFEKSTARFDQLLRTVATLVVGTERIADQFGCFVPGAQHGAGRESRHVAGAQQPLLGLQRRLVV